MSSSLKYDSNISSTLVHLANKLAPFFEFLGGAKLKELLAIGSNAISSSRNMAIDTSRDNEFRSAPHTPTRNVGVVGGGSARIDGMGSPLGAAGAALPATTTRARG